MNNPSCPLTSENISDDVNVCVPSVSHCCVPQGPCIGNQQSLAHSRLWDAVVGFLHVFANMQMKLSQVCVSCLKKMLHCGFVLSF